MLKSCLWATLLLWSSVSNAQAGPNTLAQYNFDKRTMSVNGTTFILPIDSQKVSEAVRQYPLGPVPRNNKRLFPRGFPKNKHPVVVTMGYANDIRRGQLEIDALMSAQAYVPYVDRLGDGTPFLYPLGSYLDGANGEDIMSLVPVIVGSIQANPIQVGQLIPDDAAYQPIGPDQFSFLVKEVRVPNPVTGPGVVPAAIDTTFSTAQQPRYARRTFNTLLNQPLILTNNTRGLCQRNTVYSNDTFANPVARRGSVTLYAPPLPEGIQGLYKGVGGQSVNSQIVGYDFEDCREAANNVDQKSML